MRHHIISILLSFSILTSLFAQEIEIQGTVLDADSGDPIPYASIVLPDAYKGTSSNIEGNFLFKVDSLPVKLRFSHISYESQDVLVSNEEPLMIELKPAEILMQELVVKEDETNEYVYSLVQRAYERMSRYSGRIKYGKAFYRQISQNGEDYNELFEIFFDTRFSRVGIVDWAIQEGRYALKSNEGDQEYLYNKNFTLLFRLLSMIQPETDDIIQPINESVSAYYDLKIKELINVEGNKIAVVIFRPKPEITTPIMEGEMYINIDNYDMIKMKGKIDHDDLNFVGLSTKDGYWKNYVLHFDAAYKAEPDGDVYLDYMSMRQELDYYVDDEFQNNVSTNGFITYYEYYTPERQKRLGGRLIRFRQRDRDVLDKLGYHSEFWEENPIVKRTPVEEEVIDAFEKEDAFGSIYLNNRNQLILEGNELNNDPFVKELQKNLRETRLASTGEKVYLHLDRPYYAAGETIWLKSYLINAATHEPAETSGLIYVDLVNSDGEVFATRRINSRNGQGAGQLELTSDLPEGSYLLRAYTNWMRNFGNEYFYTKRLMIYNSGNRAETSKGPSGSPKIDLQFFPEGGELIGNLPGLMAFKALKENGQSVEVKGTIFDDEGKKAGTFATSHKGMGSMIFAAKTGKSYYAVIDGMSGDVKYKLPEVRDEGFMMMVNNLKPNSVDILLKTSPSFGSAEFFLICQSRGIIYHRYKGACRNRVARIEIPKSKFPDGIVQITLFDLMKKPIAERLVFINSYQQPFMSMRANTDRIQRRERMTFDFQLKDSDGKAIKNAALSAAVIDGDQGRFSLQGENIDSYLLLNSDLRGNIENPGEYFINESRETLKKLDLVMLTHGWRRFTWADNDQAQKPEFTWRMEKGMNISGQAFYGDSKRRAANEYLDFIPVNANNRGLWNSSTDIKGRWFLKDILLTDTTRVIVRGTSGNSFKQNISIEVDDYNTPESAGFLRYESEFDEKILANYLKMDEKRRAVELSYQQSTAVTTLEEVTVEGAKIGNSMYGEPDEVLVLGDQERAYADLLQLIQGRFSGVYVTGNGPDAQIRIRGLGSWTANSTPLILLDGMIISDGSLDSSPPPTAIQNTPDAGPPGSSGGPGQQAAAAPEPAFPNQEPSTVIMTLQTINPINVERIELLKNAGSAGAFGMRGSNGVIAIYTRRGDQLRTQTQVDNINTFLLPGIHHVREFYIPDYEIKIEEHKRPDLRPTLYWNPDLRLSRRGRGRIEFYNNDEAKTIQILIEGITEDGKPIVVNELLGEKLVK